MNKEGMTNERLAALRKRLISLHSTISTEVELERRRKAREQERLVRIVGEAMLREAEESVALRDVIRETLDSCVVDPKSRRLLSNLGWI